MTIIRQLSEHQFVISLEDYVPSRLEEGRISVAHDSVKFHGTTPLFAGGNAEVKLYGKHVSSENSITIPTEVSFGIRGAQKVMMDVLKNNKYMQPEHLEDKVYSHDDPYWNSAINKDMKLKGPRFKKGDKYPAYAITNEVIIYSDNGNQMVAFRKAGEAKFSTVTYAVYKDLIEDRL